MSTKRKRPADWPQRLTDFLAAKETAPGAWGINDCALGYASDWLLELTGIDPAEGIRGTYTTALGAARIIKQRGGMLTLAEDICAAHGWPAAPVVMARRGDIVAADTPHGPALGICVGAESAFAGEHGTIYRRTLECVRAWRID